MQLSRYLKIYPYEEKPGYLLFYSSMRASATLLGESVRRAVENGTLSPEHQETLSRLGILVESADEEKAAMLRILEHANAGSTHCNAIVILNLDCNLACRYCYEGTLKGGHYMSRETADHLVEFLRKSLTPNKKSLNISFYGGEPLLSADLIEYISKGVRDYTKDRGIDYTFNLVTNGTLFTAKAAGRLAPLGLTGVKITLDGPRENHDIFRPYKSGRGSFDKIIANIRETCGIVKVGIGGNFNHENYRGFPALLDYLLGEKLTPDKLSYIKFDPILKTDNVLAPADFRDGCESINEPWIVDAGAMLREEILRRGFRTHKLVPSPCMVDIRDDIVVNFDGAIYKCPGLIGKKAFEVGDVRTGISDYSESYRLNQWKNEDCLGCEYLPLCFGGCRYMKLLRDGNIDGVDCKKAFLDATLETSIRQDLKYGLKAENG